MCWPSWNLLNPQSEEFASVASVARGFFYQRNKPAVITAITVTAHSKSITTSKSSLVNETFPKTICFFIFFSEEVGKGRCSYLSTSPHFLVNDGAGLDLFFPGLIFSAGYSFVLIVIFQLVHLSLGVNFVSCSCR